MISLQLLQNITYVLSATESSNLTNISKNISLFKKVKKKKKCIHCFLRKLLIDDKMSDLSGPEVDGLQLLNFNWEDESCYILLKIKVLIKGAFS